MDILSQGITMARADIILFKDEPDLKKSAIERYNQYHKDYEILSKKVMN